MKNSLPLLAWRTSQPEGNEADSNAALALAPCGTGSSGVVGCIEIVGLRDRGAPLSDGTFGAADGDVGDVAANDASVVGANDAGAGGANDADVGANDAGPAASEGLCALKRENILSLKHSIDRQQDFRFWSITTKTETFTYILLK